MANEFYNRGSTFNPDELADGDAIESEFDAVGRGFDTIEDLVNINKAGYPTQTFHVAPATQPTHAVQKAQLDLKLSGLDADLLDGQEGSYYRNASNINAGTLAKERLPASIDADTLGNAATATSLKTAVTINSVTFSGLSNITIEPYVEQDNTSNATRYLTFVDSGTAGYQRLKMDGVLTYNPSTNVLGATISGNAGTASKLATARTITLTGDVTGSASFDGSANATITTALSDAGVLASVATSAAGGVGTYVFGYINSNAAFAEGATYAGSSIKPAAMQRTSTAATIYGGYRSAAYLTGTWRAMGGAGSNFEINFTLFVRIS
jgi:hypothetical protein